jgi:hypothetical protein
MHHSNGNRRNQLLYREVNRRIREVSDSFGSNEKVRLICECGREDCAATFELTYAQFDGLLDDPRRVLLATKHRPSGDGARVLAEYDKFIVLAADETQPDLAA